MNYDTVLPERILRRYRRPQVAEARNLNIIRQIFMWTAIALAIFYYATHPAATAPSDDDSYDMYPEYSPQ